MLGSFRLVRFHSLAAWGSTSSTPVDLLALAVTEDLMMSRDAVISTGATVGESLWVRFGDQDGDRIELETLIPVSREDSSSGDRHPNLYSKLVPGGLAATVNHTGTYDTIPASLEALNAWIRAQGLEPIDSGYEVHTDPPEDSYDRGMWSTQLVWFVAGHSGDPRRLQQMLNDNEHHLLEPDQ